MHLIYQENAVPFCFTRRFFILPQAQSYQTVYRRLSMPTLTESPACFPPLSKQLHFNPASSIKRLYCASVNGVTDSRDWRTSGMSVRILSDLMASSVTDLGK